MLTLKLAWRNIWRNKRRTLITMVSIIVAVFLSAVMRSLQEGSYEVMIDSTIGTLTGFIQVHDDGYWEDQTLEHSFIATDSVLQVIEQTEGVTSVVPRIESYALGSGKEQSRPVMLMGIDIEAEEHLSEPRKRLESGSYFESNAENAVIVGKEVLQRLNLSIGDSLVVLGQGFRGISARGLYPVKGAVSFSNPEMNRTLVMLPLQTAQRLFAAEGRLTSASIMVDNPDQIDPAIQHLREQLPSGSFEVMGWRELMPELVQAIDVDKVSGFIMLGVLYMVVGFGILGTVLMMVAERTYEFGIMLSVGTARKRIAEILSIEIFLVSMLGSAIGILLSLPIAWYFHINPIQLTGDLASTAADYGMAEGLPFSVAPSIFLSQAITIFIITLIFSLIPIYKASNLNPVSAMRA